MSATEGSRDPARLRVLITGAAGAIGTVLHRGFAGRYGLLRLADLKPVAANGATEEAVRCDVTDSAAIAQAMQGIDCVVHLAGIPREGPWDAILPNNIAGTYNVFEAARASGVKRVVFASSNHAVGYHRAARRIGIDVDPRPDTRYGVSKVFGEAVGRLYADKHGMSVACLRIGSFRERPEDLRQLATWVSWGDMTELVRCAIEADDYHFLVVYGVSANRRARWNNPDAARIGYVPRDDAEDHAQPFAGRVEDPANPATIFHGGGFCALEFDGSVEDIT